MADQTTRREKTCPGTNKPKLNASERPSPTSSKHGATDQQATDEAEKDDDGSRTMSSEYRFLKHTPGGMGQVAFMFSPQNYEREIESYETNN